MEYISEIFIYLIKGIIIGIVASAPMGPVGILCIRRTIKKGRAYGIVTGGGAALSDLAYALLTGYGLSMVSFLTNHENVFWIKIGGCLMLCCFGIYMYRTGPRATFHPEGKSKGSLLRNGVTSFFITLCNPAIIFLFVALFNMLAPFTPTTPPTSFAGYGGIVVGAMAWWFGLTYVISKMSESFGEKGVKRLNRSIGTFVMVISLIYGLMTLLDISLIPE